DLNGMRYANRAYAEFVGVSEKDVQRHDWAQFIHPDDLEGYMKTYLLRMEQKKPFEAQARFRRADGEYRWMKSAALPRTTESGEVLGCVGCTVDIGDLKNAENLLREADVSKNRFLAVLAHELRNPLASVRNAAHVLNQSAPESDAFQRALTI